MLKNETLSEGPSRSSQSNEETKVSTRIFIGLIVGSLIGLIFNYLGPHPVIEWLLKNIFGPMGNAFLRGLFMIVVPLVFSSLVVGVANLGSAEHLGKLGTRLVGYYLCTTLCAVLIGQFLINAVEPGKGLPADYIEKARSDLADQVSGFQESSSNVNESLWPGLVDTIIPKNVIEQMSQANMLAIIFVSFLLGISLALIEKRKAAESLLSSLDAISESCIMIVGWIMKLAPYAVGALMINAVSQFGLEVMGNVAMYILVVVVGYLLQFFLTYSVMVKYLIRIPVKEFYRRIFPVVATAFSTSSSSATMPTTMRTLERRFGVPDKITTFSVPLGATVNMDGTALFEIVAALFVAQVFGVEISLTGQLTLIVLVLLTSIGVAGVPGGSIPILMSAMAALGIPPEGIALVLGVDRLLDMGRTVVNVTGDATAALFLARVEKVDLNRHLRERE